jgi:hypothetical protein
MSKSFLVLFSKNNCFLPSNGIETGIRPMLEAQIEAIAMTTLEPRTMPRQRRAIERRRAILDATMASPHR